MSQDPWFFMHQVVITSCFCPVLFLLFCSHCYISTSKKTNWGTIFWCDLGSPPTFIIRWRAYLMKLLIKSGDFYVYVIELVETLV